MPFADMGWPLYIVLVLAVVAGTYGACWPEGQTPFARLIRHRRKKVPQRRDSARFDRVTRIGWIVIWSGAIAWGIFAYLLLYHGRLFGIH